MANIQGEYNDQEEEENSWIPLSSAVDDDPSGKSSILTEYPRTANKSKNTRATSKRSSATASTSTMIRQRLETQQKLKQHFVDHPTDLIWKRLLWHLFGQISELPLSIRLGMVMVSAGVSLRLLLWSTWYIWYPKLVFGSLAMIVATLYLDLFGLQRLWRDIERMVMDSSENILSKVERLDAQGLRRLAAVLFLLPTGLEVRTFSFLSSIQAESGSFLYNLILSSSLLGFMMYSFQAKNLAARECLYRGLLVLYASALFLALFTTTDWSRLPRIAAPFFTSAGTLLITYQDEDMEWVARILRQALRLTLRDVLSSLSEKVVEDELLQLAMLRWLVDYWAFTPTEESAAPSTPGQTAPSESFPAPSSNGATPRPPAPSTTSATANNTATTTASPETEPNPAPSASTMTPNPRPATKATSTSSILSRRYDVSWQELLPMLNVATNYMSTEIQQLQQEEASPGTTTGNPSAPAKNASFVMMDGLQDMLGSLNVDERGEPAVRAYQRAVQAIPPQPSTAFVLSALRRCPATLTILIHLIIAAPSFFLSSMVLLPFVIMEFYRVQGWIRCCEQVKVFLDPVDAADAPAFLPEALKDASPMVILLIGDSYNPLRPPALLLVWKNVLNSVSALQVGLTAARCAETTAVAVQFAGNVMSLVQFGHEIHRFGILHGLMVMGKELILLHTMDQEQATARQRRREAAKYTHAALEAAESAQRVSRNVQTLVQDENLELVLQPIFWLAGTISGYAWLWGKRNTEPDITQSDAAAEAETMNTSSKLANDPPPPSEKENATEPRAGREDANVPGAGASHAVPLDRLADMMEQIVEAFGEGLLTSLQKDALCERLSHISGGDTKSLEEIEKSLQGFVDDNKKNSENHSAPRTEEVETFVSSSSVMELVLAAYYRDLINPTEKAALCQRIAKLSAEQDSNSDDSKTMVEISQALKELLDEGPGKTNGPTIQQLLALKEEVFTENLEPPTATVPNNASVKTEQLNSDAESLVRNESLTLATPDNNQTRAQNGSNTQNRSEDDKKQEVWTRLGMAALSVVVGGLLSSQQENTGTTDNRQDASGSTSHHQTNDNDADASNEEPNFTNNGSTVQIVEIEDDAEEEWVSVPQ